MKFSFPPFLLLLAGLIAFGSCNRTHEQQQASEPVTEAAKPSVDTTQAPSATSQSNTPEEVVKNEPSTVSKKAQSATGAQKNAATAVTPEVNTSPATPVKTVETPLHQAWDQLLQSYVSPSGKVNYKGFKGANADLETYLKSLTDHTPQADWSRAEKMAYWINAYNAFTIKLIVDNYPVKSIMDIHKGKPWDVKWIQLGGVNYSLNQIENEILRPQYQDARIHFALNCAARSCPPLYNRAYTAANLERSLDQRTRQFLNDQNFNKIETDRVSVSKIFEWYSSDFGALISFINKYAFTPADAAAKITYLEYDWSLNE